VQKASQAHLGWKSNVAAGHIILVHSLFWDFVVNTQKVAAIPVNPWAEESMAMLGGMQYSTVYTV
jgi:hypothetical protein